MRSASSECDNDDESPVLLTHRYFAHFAEGMVPPWNSGECVETFKIQDFRVQGSWPVVECTRERQHLYCVWKNLCLLNRK